jgi:hypothetical protein
MDVAWDASKVEALNEHFLRELKLFEQNLLTTQDHEEDARPERHRNNSPEFFLNTNLCNSQ